MPGEGLEPSRAEAHRILRPSRETQNVSNYGAFRGAWCPKRSKNRAQSGTIGTIWHRRSIGGAAPKRTRPNVRRVYKSG